jgi:3-hydroxybutyryl-CoA dehydratase
MTEIRRRTVRGLAPGDTFEVTRTFHRKETRQFGRLTRDDNPVHSDPAFAAAQGFDQLILHGLLTGSMICEVGGQIGWLARTMKFEFLAPVFFGDTVTCRVTISSIEQRTRARARATYRNQRGELVLRAELTGRIPDGDVRGELGRILAEDPVRSGGTRV